MAQNNVSQQFNLYDIFDELKEKQAESRKIDIKQLEDQLSKEDEWKADKQTFFQGDYDVFVNNDMVIIIDKIANNVFFLKDNDNIIINFIQSLEDFIFNKLPEIEIAPEAKQIEAEVDGYKLYVNVYNEEAGISKMDVSKTIKRFIYNNYVVKNMKNSINTEEEQENDSSSFRVEIKKEKGVITVKGDTIKIKEMLKSHGFKWNKDQKCWEKKGQDGIDIVEETINFLEENELD